MPKGRPQSVIPFQFPEGEQREYRYDSAAAALAANVPLIARLIRAGLAKTQAQPDEAAAPLESTLTDPPYSA